jgi:DNA-binding transcriptional regulator GbsR (MarR family)
VAWEVRLEEARERYVEDLGLLFDQMGGGPMMGRVFGALLLADPPELSAEDLANSLQASRSSISQATRMLVQAGLIERRRRRGERRDYFRVKPGAWDSMVRQRVQALSTLRKVAERGLEIMATGSPESRLDLEEMRDYFDFWEHELLPIFFEKLEQRQMMKGEP